MRRLLPPLLVLTLLSSACSVSPHQATPGAVSLGDGIQNPPKYLASLSLTQVDAGTCGTTGYYWFSLPDGGGYNAQCLGGVFSEVTGPTGSPGATGATGPTGATGAAGTAGAVLPIVNCDVTNPTAAQVVSGFICTSTSITASITLPTWQGASGIVQVSGKGIGYTWPCGYLFTTGSAGAWTITVGTGGTKFGTASGTYVPLICSITGITASSETGDLGV